MNFIVPGKSSNFPQTKTILGFFIFAEMKPAKTRPCLRGILMDMSNKSKIKNFKTRPHRCTLINKYYQGDLTMITASNFKALFEVFSAEKI